VRELPYRFREREQGESKLDTLIAWEYGMLLADKLFGKFIPVRFALFSLIGGLGLLVHLTTLWIALDRLGFEFSAALVSGTIVAMTSNFFLNNQFIYRDQRLLQRAEPGVEGAVAATLHHVVRSPLRSYRPVPINPSTSVSISNCSTASATARRKSL
jgi:hypothetical protein